MSTRERILDGAVRVIQTLGLARATTKEIAREVGLSEAALYKHFRDKEQLFLHLLRERLPHFIDSLQRLPSRVGEGSVAQHLEDLAVEAAAFFREVMPMSAALFASTELLNAQRAAAKREGVGPHLAVVTLAAYLRAEQTIGRVGAGCDADAAAALLLGACFHRAFVQSFFGEAHDDAAARAFAKGLVKTLGAGLGAA